MMPLNKIQPEQPREVYTVDEMRREIERLARDDALIHNVMTSADISGASAEDRYTMLAYYALVERAKAQQRIHRFLLNSLVDPSK